ncbi:MAG: hypothetical protein J7M26_05535 [Armatimonadetes bacterium]|nr:hypothetical protein [Armatimonadota bacterium]
MNPRSLRADRTPVVIAAMALAALLIAAAAVGLVPLPIDHLRAMAPWSILLPGTAPPANTWDSLWWDGVAQFLPWRTVAADALKSGQMPLWSPWSFCGQPFAANAQSACFYPAAVVFLLLFSPARAMSLLWLFHLALAAFLTYGLARRMNATPAGALAAGIVYAGGGFMLAWAPVPSLMQSAAWLPGALWAVEALLHERPWRGALALGACLALALLAGHMQVGGYVWLTTFLWATGRLIGRAIRHKPWPVLPVALGFVLALGLAAVQILPTAELGKLSPRGGAVPTAAGYQFAKLLALKPVHLLTLAWPFALGVPGDGTAVEPAFAEHYAGLGPLSFLLMVLAVVGNRRKHTYGMLALALLALLVAMGTPLAALLYFHLPFLGQTAGFQRLLFVACLGLAVVAGLGLDAAVLKMAEGGRKVAARGVTGALLVLLLAQACVLTARLLPLTRIPEVTSSRDLGALVGNLAGQDHRVLALTPRRDWTLRPRPQALMPPNTPALVGLQDVQGYDSLYPRVVREYAATVEGTDPAPMTNGNMLLLEGAEARAYAELGVRYVLSRWPIGSPRLRKMSVFEVVPGAAAPSEELYIYERTDWAPRWRVRRGEGVKPARAVEVKYNWLRLEVAGKGGWLEVADTPYPGWRAFLDGRPVTWTMAPAQPMIRRLSLPGDGAEHVVDYVFWPTTFVVGSYLSLLALVALTAGFVLRAGRP